ncbi:hypothetical protein CDL15_Pgr024806 [Punica granatum]|uniref:Uncharacterized protein n=1 Tax=Punica granatum TaxID=22663 RepID=A0A218WIT3_PUNGR|nr:hypothetical protein CDL15_Pgr024806 [Punica granatum]
MSFYRTCYNAIGLPLIVPCRTAGLVIGSLVVVLANRVVSSLVIVLTGLEVGSLVVVLAGGHDDGPM